MQPKIAAVGLGVVALAVGIAIISPWSTDSASETLQGDADCNQHVDSLDALADLRDIAGLMPSGGCVDTAGNVDCDDGIDTIDVLGILRHVAGIEPNVPNAPPGCPAVGEPIDAGTQTPASQTPTPGVTSPGQTPTMTPPVTASPTPSPSPTPAMTPVAGGYTLNTVVNPGLSAAVDFVLIPGQPDQGVVVLQSGEVWRVSLTAGFAPALFGDVSGLVSTAGNEEGLLSLAFSPGFGQDGRVYLYYTRGSPQPSVLARFQATAADLDEGSEQVLLEVPQPHANHNGGRIVFGKDGYLYLSTGDGGSGGDPDNYGQDVDSLLGKVLRLDVSGAAYTSPVDNPYIGTHGRDEIFALGLRNPFRMSVDRQTGDIWLGDVGQGVWEEVDRIVKGGNYGWRCYEGPEAFNTDGCGPESGYTFPRASYNHDFGAAVTGGYVYRGNALPELYGWYVYADFYSGNIWAVNAYGAGNPILLTQQDVAIAAFQETAEGDLLIVTYSDGIMSLARN